jgi:hypothetical protein
MEDFKKWLYDGRRQRKPFAKYKKMQELTKQLAEAIKSAIIQ